MKKLMIAAAIVCAAAFVQAASIDWTINAQQWKTTKGSNGSSGTQIYLIDGSTSLSTIMAAINAETGVFNADQTWVFESDVKCGNKGAVAKTVTTSDNLTAGNSYAFSTLIIDASDAANGNIYYLVSKGSNQKAYTKGVDEALSVTYDATFYGENAQTFNKDVNAYGWAKVTSSSDVPEPTSGLLLLLGVAGLALKRKRA